MFSQLRRPSDLESTSTQTSDVTSRATTIPDWEVDAGLTSQQGGDWRNIQMGGEATRSSTNTESVDTVINTQRTGNSQFTQNNAANQQRQPWVNPYWSSNAPGVHYGTSASKGVQQLIPGSIMINDRGEIDNKSLPKQNTGDSNRTGSYLTPTNIQRPVVTSSPGVAKRPENPPSFKRSSSSSQAVSGNRQVTEDNNIQPWVNPYWPKSNQTASAGSTKSNGTWTNPYWKDSKPQNSTAPKPEDKEWKNPYWKDWKPQNSTASKPEDKEWKNPYWKDWKPQNSTASKPEDKQWKNPYWKDWKPQGASAERKAPPIPSFYKRVYPPPSPSSSPAPTQTYNQNINDNDDLPFTVDNQGAAHYRGTAPSSMNSNTAQFNSSPTTSQYPVSPPKLSSTPPPSQPLFSTSLFQANHPAPPLVSNLVNYPSSTSSEIVLTEADLNSIQDALQLLATNPNAIPVISTPNQVPSSNIGYTANDSMPLFDVNREQQSHPLPLSALVTTIPGLQSNQQHLLPPRHVIYSTDGISPLSNLFTKVPQEQSHPKGLVSSSSPTQPFNYPPYSYDPYSQQLTVFSTPSYPSRFNERLHPLLTQGHILHI